MIKYIGLFLLLLSGISSAAVRMELQFENGKIKQGAIESAKVLLSPEATQKIQLQKLKGQALANTVYLYEVSPLVRKEGANSYEADVRVIFVKVPETKFISFKDGAEEVAVSWNDIEVVPTEAKGFTYEHFSIPSRPKIIAWTLIFLALIFLGLGGRQVFKKLNAKKKHKERLAALKNEILSANEYQSVVTVWMKRAEYLKVFPQIEPAFRELESVLFKYVFKSQQSDIEKNIVMEAYKSFLSKISGGLNGV